MAEWNFDCPDWEMRLAAGLSLVPPLPLNEDAARLAVDTFNNLRLPDIAGTPLLAEAAGDWFRDIVAAIFGSVDNGRRRVHEVFLEVVKKSSKTTNSSALMLTAMLLNDVPLADFLLIGPTQHIAERAFEQAAGMIRADPEGYLLDRFHIRDHNKTIVDRVTDAKLRVKTFSADVLTGVIPHGVLIDEVHLLGAIHYAEKVIRQIRGGLLSKPATRFLVFITTQSDSPPAGVFKKELALARKIRDGKVKGPHIGMLPVLYEFPEAMQRAKDRPWLDVKNWPMVMPNLGRSIQLREIIDDYENEKEKGEDAIRIWASQHLNVEIGLALHGDRWAGADHWEAAAEKELTLDKLIERSEVAVIGVDGGGLDDLLGVCVIGREKSTSRWLAWYHAFCHVSVLEERKEIAPRLLDFEQDGDLWIYGREAPLTDEPEPVVIDEDDAVNGDPERVLDEDIAGVVDIIQRVHDAGLLPEVGAIGLDPEETAVIVDALAAMGLTIGPGKQVIGVAQGYRLNAAIKGMARKLVNGSMRHDGSRLMNWCVGNVKAEQRGNAVIVTKQAAGKAKIDPFAAGLNAFMLMSANPDAGGGTYLDEEDVILV